jgi:hypothetical protein
MRVIMSLEELEALPDGTAYLMPNGSIGRVRKWSAISHGVLEVIGSMSAMHPNQVPLPVQVVWEP